MSIRSTADLVETCRQIFRGEITFQQTGSPFSPDYRTAEYMRNTSWYLDA